MLKYVTRTMKTGQNDAFDIVLALGESFFFFAFIVTN